MDSDAISAGIVSIQRTARFGATTPGEWAGRLVALVSAQGVDFRDVKVSNVRQVGTAAGGSNGTLLFDVEYDAGGELVRRSLVLRFLPEKGLFHRYDVTAQFRLQQALAGAGMPVPGQLWLDAAGAYLGTPGYVMEQVSGVSTPMAWMTSGIIADAAPADRRKMSHGYVRALAQLHAVDWRRAGLDWLQERATGARPIERETNWYWDALIWCDDAHHAAMLAPVRDWLIANEPADVDVVVCHGDANFGNYLYDGVEVSAVVDWEMAFLGAPECDISFLKVGDAILLDGVPWPEGVATYDEMRTEYERVSGRKLRHMDYFELFSAFRLAVINVLAMKHFPPEQMAVFLPVLRRGPDLCVARAAALGVALGASSA